MYTLPLPAECSIRKSRFSNDFLMEIRRFETENAGKMQPKTNSLQRSFQVFEMISIFFADLELQFECSSKSIPHFFFSYFADMGVDITGCFNVAVTEPFLDIFQLPAGIIKNTGRAMTNIMKSHVRKSVPL